MASFWIFSAFSNKKTIHKSGGWTLRIIAIIIIFSVFYIQKNTETLSLTLWSQTTIILIISDIVTLAGLIVMIWSRITLGKNWSANVVLKEEHELIISGPYSFVRHPIYSGLLLMILGVTLYAGSFAWAFLLILFFVGAYFKALKEEELMIKQFPQEYNNYKMRVRALIPFIF
jgi:protein-S-isoprenylcysteine O-methyltransferase